MYVKKTGIPGCFEIVPSQFKDDRGSFVKTFHQPFFDEHGFESRFREEYYTVSQYGVLRGLHFQVPPEDHVKLVYCIAGEILDVVLDLRVGSPTYGKYQLFDLSGENANMVYIPKGLAHGFYVTGGQAVVMYKVSTVHSPSHDSGILWNSADIPWPTTNPVLSKRDTEFTALKDFKSPFRYCGA